MPAPTPDQPPTRWELAGDSTNGYGEHFARLVAGGEDVDGEARLADALVPRGARILDVGSGMGRVAEALRRRGHDVVATEPDPALRAQSLSTYPDLAVLPHAALALDPGEHGGDDLVVVVGNVMIFVGEGTERAVLTRLRELLAPGGRLLVGFHLSAVKSGSRTYPPEEFVGDAAAAGLLVDQRFGTYELHPPADDYAVWILSAAG
ncbi:MAG: methyltransferase domain-containing protein [Nocardioides sp.]